jgi:predicted DCC family thiol-disulfide oxidoreductase YuxK
MSHGATASEPELNNQVRGRPLMLYDGMCGMCNHAVLRVIRRDQADRFRFAPQQSPLAQAILSRHGIDRETLLDNNTIYLVLDAGSHRERLLERSDVWVKTLLVLGGRWRILGYVLRAVPSFARDAVYRLIAGNRHRLSRRSEVCPLPTEAERMKFLG